ncbi:MAG: EAL domain-containing protein, partial [Lachnospiraceae bacterium]|nr:EAL domain-containing protein [Lachnospiraceae bacterium]
DYSKCFIRLVSDLCETLGASICVEGVEKLRQYQILKNMKVKFIQGFYFDKPMPLKDFEKRYCSTAPKENKQVEKPATVEKPAAKPATVEKPAAKPAEKTVAEPAKKPAKKATEKVASKPATTAKPIEKKSSEPAKKPAAKTAATAAKKPAEKANGKAASTKAKSKELTFDGFDDDWD